MTNSRRKGHTFERRVCADLRTWLGREWVVQRNLDDDQTGARGRAGDVLVSGGPHRWPFAIECKTGYGLRSSHFWKGSATLEEMWAQTVGQAAAVELEPLLVVKPDETAHPALALMRPAVRRTMRPRGPGMALRVNGQRVDAVLWGAILEVAPIALLEVERWREARHAPPARVVEEVGQDLASWDWLMGGGDGTD